MQYSKFAVDETPFCMWEPDLAERNRRFVEGLDPAVFTYVADICAPDSGEGYQSAATLGRFMYFQALEAFFALAAATIQAPDCVIGWLMKYSPRDLRSVTTKVQKGQMVFTKFKERPVTWDLLSRAVNRHNLEDAKLTEIQTGFHDLWQRLARDYLDEKLRWEHNSIKHGLRTRPGGFRLAIGRERTPGKSADSMINLGGSEYGSSFFRDEHLARKGRHFRGRNESVNWQPENNLWGLRMVHMSMVNVLAFLKTSYGVPPTDVKLLHPADSAYFRKPWARRVAVGSSSMDFIVHAEDIRDFSREEILEVYDDPDDKQRTCS